MEQPIGVIAVDLFFAETGVYIWIGDVLVKYINGLTTIISHDRIYFRLIVINDHLHIWVPVEMIF